MESRTDSVGKSLVNAFAFAGITLGITQAVQTLANFEQQMSTVKGVTKATEEEFSQLREEARKLGETTRFSATQAAEAMVELGKAGFEVDEVLGSVSETLLLAQAGGLGLGQAADIASNILTGFNLDVKETGRVVDVLATAATSSNTTVGELGEAMKYASAVSKGFEVSLEEASAAVATLSDAGIKASMAGTGLRNVLVSLEGPNAANVKRLKELGLTTEDVKVSQHGLTVVMKRLKDAGVDTAMAMKLFGLRGGPAFEIMSAGIPKIKLLTEKFKNSAGNAKKLADVMDDNLNGALLSVSSAAESVILSLGKEGLTSLLTELFKTLASGLRSLAANAATVLDSLQALTTFLVITYARYAIPLAIKMTGLFTAALLANPLMAVAVALALVVSLLVGFSDKIDIGSTGVLSLQDVSLEVFSSIGMAISSMALGLKDAFVEVRSQTSEYLSDLKKGNNSTFEGIKKSTANLLDDITDYLSNMVDGHDKANKIIEESSSKTTKTISGNIDFLDSKYIVHFKAVEFAADEIVKSLGGEISGYGAFFSEIFKGIVRNSDNSTKSMELSFKNMTIALSRIFDVLLGAVKGLVVGIVMWIQQIPTELSKIPNAASSFFHGFMQKVTKVSSYLGKKLDIPALMMAPLKGGAPTLVGAAKGIGLNVADAIAYGMKNENYFENELDEMYKRLDDLATKRIAKIKEQTTLESDLSKNQIDAAEKLKAVEKAAEEAATRANLILAEKNKRQSEAAVVIASLVTKQELYNEKIKSLNNLWKHGELNEIQYGKAAQIAFEALNAGAEKSNMAMTRGNETIKKTESLLKDLETPAEKYAKKLNEIDSLYKKGLISVEKYNNANEKAYETLMKSDEKHQEMLGKAKSLLDELATPQENYIEKQKEINDLYDQGYIGVEKFGQANKKAYEEMLESNDDAFSGIERSFINYQKNSKTAADVFEDGFTNAFKSLEDNMVSFVRTGKMDFSDMIDSFIDDLIRLAAREIIINPIIEGISGGGGGGLFGKAVGFVSSIFGGFFADGGRVDANKAHIVGEEGPEWFIPDSPGTILPNGKSPFETRNPNDHKSNESIENSQKSLNILYDNSSIGMEKYGYTGEKVYSVLSRSIKDVYTEIVKSSDELARSSQQDYNVISNAATTSIDAARNAMERFSTSTSMTISLLTPFSTKFSETLDEISANILTFTEANTEVFKLMVDGFIEELARLPDSQIGGYSNSVSNVAQVETPTAETTTTVTVQPTGVENNETEFNSKNLSLMDDLLYKFSNSSDSDQIRGSFDEIIKTFSDHGLVYNKLQEEKFKGVFDQQDTYDLIGSAFNMIRELTTIKNSGEDYYGSNIEKMSGSKNTVLLGYGGAPIIAGVANNEVAKRYDKPKQTNSTSKALGLDLLKSQINDRNNLTAGMASGLTQLRYRALGGPVSPKNPYMVGEQGPELFIPDSHGTILSNSSSKSIENGQKALNDLYGKGTNELENYGYTGQKVYNVLSRSIRDVYAVIIESSKIMAASSQQDYNVISNAATTSIDAARKSMESFSTLTALMMSLLESFSTKFSETLDKISANILTFTETNTEVFKKMIDGFIEEIKRIPDNNFGSYSGGGGASSYSSGGGASSYSSGGGASSYSSGGGAGISQAKNLKSSYFSKKTIDMLKGPRNQIKTGGYGIDYDAGPRLSAVQGVTTMLNGQTTKENTSGERFEGSRVLSRGGNESLLDNLVNYFGKGSYNVGGSQGALEGLLRLYGIGNVEVYSDEFEKLFQKNKGSSNFYGKPTDIVNFLLGTKHSMPQDLSADEKIRPGYSNYDKLENALVARHGTGNGQISGSGTSILGTFKRNGLNLNSNSVKAMMNAFGAPSNKNLWSGKVGSMIGVARINDMPSTNVNKQSPSKASGLPQLRYRALGGPVSSKTPYMVGEQGPEIFVPNAPGYIIPNNDMKKTKKPSKEENENVKLEVNVSFNIKSFDANEAKNAIMNQAQTIGEIVRRSINPKEIYEAVKSQSNRNLNRAV
ncbi:MAG: phage tail tape measure protein [bacterium]